MTHEIWEVAAAIRKDLDAANAKLVELLSQLAGLNLTDSRQKTCPWCGARFKGPHTLGEHLYVSHDGPLPEHWQRADELAAAGEWEVAQ